MSTKKMEKGGEVVTEKRLAVLLSRFAQAADASLNLKMEQMREEILSELRLPSPLTEWQDPRAMVAARDALLNTILDKEAAPTDSEGGE